MADESPRADADEAGVMRGGERKGSGRRGPRLRRSAHTRGSKPGVGAGDGGGATAASGDDSGTEPAGGGSSESKTMAPAHPSKHEADLMSDVALESQLAAIETLWASGKMQAFGAGRRRVLDSIADIRTKQAQMFEAQLSFELQCVAAARRRCRTMVHCKLTRRLVCRGPCPLRPRLVCAVPTKSCFSRRRGAGGRRISRRRRRSAKGPMATCAATCRKCSPRCRTRIDSCAARWTVSCAWCESPINLAVSKPRNADHALRGTGRR